MFYFECCKCGGKIFLKEIFAYIEDNRDTIKSLLHQDCQKCIKSEIESQELISSKIVKEFFNDFYNSESVIHRIAVDLEHSHLRTNCTCQKPLILLIWIEFFSTSHIFRNTLEVKIDDNWRVIETDIVENPIYKQEDCTLWNGTAPWKLKSRSFIAKGKEISEIITQLILHWTLVDPLFPIIIAMPFIDIDWFWNQLLIFIKGIAQKCILPTPEFFIFTRAKSHHNNQTQTLAEQILSFLEQKKCPETDGVRICENDPLNPCVHNLGFLLFQHIYQANQFFHAKYLRCDGELVFTSYR